MGDTVFWSWQDDLPIKPNREFIRNCLADAVKEVSDALDVDDMDRIELDHDTNGASGMVDFSQTISEKIKACSVMVADVTPTATTERGKFLPNPNVMIELGYAMASIEFDRIIAILNTAYGDKAKTLSFDIRHLRILTYALTADAPKAERQAERKVLTLKLVDAIKTNINKVRSESTAEDIKGVNNDAKTDGLWHSSWPIKHLGADGTSLKVTPVQTSRAWLRVIPCSFAKGIPMVAKVNELSDGKIFWAPGGRSGSDWGTCEFGFLTYRDFEDDEGTRQARNLAAYLEKTGEIWMSDGGAFYPYDNAKQKIDHVNLYPNWARGVEEAMACLDALEASTHRRVIVGIEGMNNTFWHRQENLSSAPVPSRKPKMVHDVTKRKWSVPDQEEFLMKAWNKLRDAYSRVPMTAEDFAEFHATSKSSR